MTRLAFFGTPESAVVPLRALVDDGHDVVLVVTRADKRRGRGARLLPSPVKAAAIDLGLSVTHDPDAVLDRDAELGVVVAYGRLIKPHLLARLPMVNLHFSLLPRWRGAAPVERALLAGDPTTGVCLMALDEGLDTGPVFACEEVVIGSEETAGELRERLVAAGTRLLVDRLRHGLGNPVPQEGEPTYAAKLDTEDHHLDWTRPAEELHRLIRVGEAWTTFRGKRFRVLRAALVPGPLPGWPAPSVIHDLVVGCGDGAGLRLRLVQPEGRRPMPAEAWANGARPAPGERLGE